MAEKSPKRGGRAGKRTLDHDEWTFGYWLILLYIGFNKYIKDVPNKVIIEMFKLLFS